MNQGRRFAFGANWQSFVDTALTDQRVDEAVRSLRVLLQVDDLQGRHFLDIGCGSGLFSLAACLLGAERVVAFDYDPNSVAASVALRSRMNVPVDRWHISQGSILDKSFFATVEPAEVVYAWGVLHHTGAMWEAIDNTVACVKPGGIVAIAIYNNVERRLGGSAMWWRIKCAYNHCPGVLQRIIEYLLFIDFMSRQLVSLRNPLKTLRNYAESNKGMEFWHNLRDWVGGFPYEYATAGEVFNYVHRKFSLDLEYLNTHDGHGCNEYLFKRPSGGASPRKVATRS